VKSYRRVVVRTSRTSLGKVLAELECGHEVLLGECSSAGMRRKSRVVCPECREQLEEEREVKKGLKKGPRLCRYCGCKLRSGNRDTVCSPCLSAGKQGE